MARAIAGNFGEVFEGTAEALPCVARERQFDVVLLSHVLEHCIDPVAALLNVKRLLATGGVTIIELPNNAALGFEMLGPAWFFADIPRHLHFFTENSLRKVLARVGLRVTRTIYTGYTRQFSPEWLDAQKEIQARIGRSDRAGSRYGNAKGGNPWELFAKTAFAPALKKYDSIRVHAVGENP